MVLKKKELYICCPLIFLIPPTIYNYNKNHNRKIDI